MTAKRNSGCFLILILLITLSLSACESTPEDIGSAQLGVSVQALSADYVDHVTITISGDNISPDIVRNLHMSQGHWKGIVGGIPVGTNRTFVAQAFDGSDELIYTGEATGVEIIQGEKASVVILLQQETPPDPFENTAPTINSLVASSTAVFPYAPLDLEVTASDVDPGDTLTYTWTSTGGAFDNDDSSTPIWTAPNSTGLYTLTIEVKDSKNAVRILSLNVDVQTYHGRGRGGVEVDFNTWPEIAEVNAEPTRLNINETTVLTVDASDNDGDTLSYVWTDNGGDCTGTFNDSEIQNPAWTAPGTLPTAEICILTVTVTDGRGGTNTGTITINIGVPEEPNIAPTIKTSYQSTEEAGDTEVVFFGAEAIDVDGDTVTFDWEITTGNGTFSNETGTDTTSDIEFTSDGYKARITVIITDSKGASTEYQFIVNAELPPEFEVESDPVINQQAPSTGMADDGSFVIVWQSDEPDEDGLGIYGRHYDIIGNPIGEEFHVNTYTTGDQIFANIAMAGDGSFVVVWQSLSLDEQNLSIHGQRFDSSGSPVGIEFQANTYTDYDQSNPSVAMADDGSFVVVWQSENQDTFDFGVYCQRYDSDGNPAGNEFKINTYTDYEQSYPEVAIADNGDFVVVWRSLNQVNFYDIFSQRFNATGTAVGSEFMVNTYFISLQDGPHIAMSPDGYFTVVWSSFALNDDAWDVYGQRFDDDGGLLGDEFLVNTDFTFDEQRFPQIAMLADHSFSIVWQSQGEVSGIWGVYGQHYNSLGATIGSKFMVNNTTDHDHTAAAIAASDNDTYVVAWQGHDLEYEGSVGIFAKLYD